jgi:hypothetical protein
MSSGPQYSELFTLVITYHHNNNTPTVSSVYYERGAGARAPKSVVVHL